MRNLGEVIIDLFGTDLTDKQKGLVLELLALAARASGAQSVTPELSDPDKRRRDSFRRAGLDAATWSIRRASILERDGPVCAYCATEDGPFEIDHVIPISRGGSHEPDNLTVACRPCNRSKKDRTPDEWLGVKCR